MGQGTQQVLTPCPPAPPRRRQVCLYHTTRVGRPPGSPGARRGGLVRFCRRVGHFPFASLLLVLWCRESFLVLAMFSL